jgi:hypothetical protein
VNETFSVAAGGAVESFQPHGFSQVYGIWVNNFSGGWLGIEGQNLWVPPYTRGWKATIFPGTSSVTVRSYDFANGIVITGATGQAAQVTLWDEPQGDSEGIAFFNQQTIPQMTRQVGIVTPTGPQALLPPAPVGRWRIYELGLFYDTLSGAVGPLVSSGVIADIFSSSGVIRTLQISPATPVDRIILPIDPATDLAIGDDVWMLAYCVADVGVAQYITVYMRYAEI